MRSLSLACFLLFALAVAAFADSTAVALPPVRAVRTTHTITIDGVLSEDVWKADNAVTNFLQRDPNEGASATQKSEVRVAYDDDAIYVGARLYDTHPDSIIARLVRRDYSIPTDRFALYLDPYHDKRSGYYFLVNAAGTLLDGTVYNDGWEDGSWDGVWNARVKIDELGWTAEMRIPYSQLRFQKSEQYVWGINFRRVIQRYNEEDFVVFQPKKSSGFVSRFPELHGIEHVNPGAAIELMPYFTTKAPFVSKLVPNPFKTNSINRTNGGGDLRMGLGSRLTLNATVNPDFGQVEVDPAVVNLSDFETFFPEKRPFFVEGSSTFQFGQEGADNYWGFNWPQPTFFYSRRIGRPPVGSGPDGVNTIDIPNVTTILGAAKVTGKLTPTFNFGTMHAITQPEKGLALFGDGARKVDVEPLTYYGVMRGQKEFKDRKQGLGFMGTATARGFENAADLRGLLNEQSFFTGVDSWAFLDKDKMWVISGWSGMSHVRGSKERMTSLQSNSAHYFQRPDADHVELDPNATSLTGFGSRYWLNKQKGSSFANAAVGFMDPKFDVNDMGFMSRSDVINGHAGAGYKWTDTGKARKYQEVLFAGFDSHDFQGNPIWGGLYLAGSTEFINNYSWNYSTAYNWQTVNTRRTRGGPLTINKPGYEFTMYFDTDGKSKLFYFADAYSYFQESGSYNYSFYPGVEWKPVSNFMLRVGPGYEKVVEDAQYVTRIADPSATETYANRYVFANLDQTTVSAQIRLNVSLTPNLSLQTFLQPLISSGAYTGYKALARPRTYSFTPYDYAATADYSNPDFNFMSLRGNAIMRWEYLPGSTLFLVWTQERIDEESVGDFNFSRSSSRLFDVRPNNVFLAKVSYYLSR